MEKRFFKAAFFACLMMVSLLVAPQLIQAQELSMHNVQSGLDLVPLLADPIPNYNNIRSSQPLDELVSNAEALTSTFTINYLPAGSDPYGIGDTCIAWPTDAKSAFNSAVSLWASKLNSSVPITIDACWANNLPSGVLGHSTPLYVYKDFTGAPKAGTYYTGALANAIAGSKVNTGKSDMYIAYSNVFSWYLGTDGNPPTGQYDFVSVVTHEIAHGLGFMGLMSYSSGQGAWGISGYPSVYDRFTVTGTGQSLINTAIFPNPSTALGSALTSGNVFFNGANASSANGGSPAKIYAPPTWRGGSSYSHLDYDTYTNTPNALMVYAISSGRAIHDQGPVTMGLLKDLGWPISSGSAPTVSSTVPTSGATGVAISAPITAIFSKAMNASTITTTTFTLKKGTTAVTGAVSYNSTTNTATFTPSANLTSNTVYTATITTGVKDTAGTAMTAAKTWSFTTAVADTTKPTVTAVTPANGVTGVAISSVLTATFSEAMNAATISTTTFTLKKGTTAVTGTVSYNSTTKVATFTPAATLSGNSVYTATITTGVKDTAGNALAAAKVWSFTTGAADTTKPTVTAVTPANGATGVAISSVVTATFSEAMNAATISTATFTLKKGTTAVTGTVSYNSTTKIATFTPSASLTNNTLYTATITTGVKDTAGNAMSTVKTWSFTTAATALPNLTPYNPSGWSGKVVITKTSGSTTDSTPLYSTDTLYVDWAVLNSSTTTAITKSFGYTLYIDGTARTSWTAPSLAANYYNSVIGYSIGTLSAGTHTIKITADPANVIAESNETDNSYTKTITVTSAALPNLAPYKPSGWSDKVVVTKTSGSITDSTPLYTTDSLYVDWAVLNSSTTTAITKSFGYTLYIDGTARTSWTAPSLAANYYNSVIGYSIGTLSAGTHTIKITADPSNVIAESNEADNSYTKTITVL